MSTEHKDIQFTQPGPNGTVVLYELRVERGERRLVAYHNSGRWVPVSTSEAMAVLWDEVQTRVKAAVEVAR